MIKTGGINVAPTEVEEFLTLHDAVRDAAVTGVADERLGEAVVAFVVPVADAAPDVDEIRDWCTARIAAYKIPARIHVVASLPRTDTGKLARKRLPEIDAELSAALTTTQEAR
jgi:fatty-acyl-CoA synthase